MTSRWRKAVARVLVVLVMAGCCLMGGAQSAVADECKPGGIPVKAGSGIAGAIDDQVNESTGTRYGEYGWSNLSWYTCDLGDGNAVRDQMPDITKDYDAVVDTWTGSTGMGFATFLAAMMTQLHEWVSNPGGLLAPIDSRIAAMTQIISDAVWTPWGGAVILLAGAFIGVWGWNSGNTRRIGRTVGAILIACMAVSWFTAKMTVEVPTDQIDMKSGKPIVEKHTVTGAEYAAKAFDTAAIEIVGTVDRAILTSGSKDAAEAQERIANAEEARGAVLHDRVLYEFWALGATGASSANKDSQAWKSAEKLYAIQSVKWSDTADAADRQEKYKAAAEELKEKDPVAYQKLRGKGYDRTGIGMWAAAYMLLIAIIRVPAELMILIGLLVIRFVVILGPLFALAAVLEATRPIATMALKMVLAAVYNVAVFGVIAAVHSAIVSALVGPNLGSSFVLIVALTVVIWVISKPFRSVSKPATGEAVANQMQSAETMPGRALGALKSVAGSAIGSYIGSRRGTQAGAEDAGDSEDQKTTPQDSSGGTPEQGRNDPDPEPAPNPNPEGGGDGEASPRPVPINGTGGTGSPELAGGGGTRTPELEGRGTPELEGHHRGGTVLPDGQRPPLELTTGRSEDQSTTRREISHGNQPEEVSAPPIRREVEGGGELYVPDTVVIKGEVVGDPVDTPPGELTEPEVDDDGHLSTDLFDPHQDREMAGV